MTNPQTTTDRLAELTALIERAAALAEALGLELRAELRPLTKEPGEAPDRHQAGGR